MDLLKNELKCQGCSSTLHYAPGTKSLKCPACGTTTDIETTTTVVEEIDLAKFLSEKLSSEEKLEVVTVTCSGCGAGLTLRPNVSADLCPYCATSLVLKSGSTSTVLKPKLILPFRLTNVEAQDAFSAWIKGLWFAPNNIKRLANGRQSFEGIYIPYWTYDSSTTSSYSGMRGDNYYETETYTAYENGKAVTRTRTVTKTRWRSVSGHVARNFDDVLVVASRSLPENYAQALDPWDLHEISNFDERFLSGFRTEMYQLTVSEGWEKGKQIMDGVIRGDVNRDIGGDHQRIMSLQTTHAKNTFKLILLPIWISSYRYGEKIYRFLVNGRTGEVQGERPYSKWKIFFLAVFVIGIICLWMMSQQRNL